MLDAFYRILRLAFPASLRRRWGNDMAQLVPDQMDDAEARGESRAKILWLAAWDALWSDLPTSLRRPPRGQNVGATLRGNPLAWGDR